MSLFHMDPGACVCQTCSESLYPKGPSSALRRVAQLQGAAPSQRLLFQASSQLLFLCKS